MTCLIKFLRNEKEIWKYIFIRLYETAIKLGQLQAQFRLQVDPEEYARDNLKFGLVEVVYEWAKVTIFLQDVN